MTRVAARTLQQAAPANTSAGAPAREAQVQAQVETPAVPSAATQAAARLGDALAAQVRQAGTGQAADSGTTANTEAGAQDTSAGAAAAAAVATAPSGGAAAGAQGESSDYIAEADTNNDRKVSEQERIAYEKKLARAEQEHSREAGATPGDARAQAMQRAYAPEATSGTQVATSA